VRKSGITNSVDGPPPDPCQKIRNAMRPFRRAAVLYSLAMTAVVVALFLAEGRFSLEDFVILAVFELFLGAFAAAPWCMDRSSPNRAESAEHPDRTQYDGPLTETGTAAPEEAPAFRGPRNFVLASFAAALVLALVLGLIVVWRWSSSGQEESSPAVVIATHHQGHHVECGHLTETSCDREPR